MRQRRYLRPLLLILSVLTLIACQPDKFGSPATLRHARYLQLRSEQSATEVSIVNPWDSLQLLAHFVLLPEGDSLPPSLSHLPRVHTPMSHCAALSTVHAALALRLGVGSNIVGLADAEWAVSEPLRKAALPPLGSSTALNPERLAELGAKLVLSSPFEGAARPAWTELCFDLPCVDYMETSPLGRAEWMRLFGKLWGVSEKADSLFQAEESAYRALSDSLRNKPKPRVMLDLPMQNQWFVPGGKSYLAQVIADAGGNYLFADLPKSGSVALSPERVLERCASQADVWVIKHHDAALLNRNALAQSNKLYTQFRPYERRAIFFCNTLQQPYYEELPFAPSLLLREWVKMLHPESLPRYTPQYFFPMK